jgi:hypothetical protein
MQRLSFLVLAFALGCTTPPAAPPDASTGGEPSTAGTPSPAARATPPAPEGEDGDEGEGEATTPDPGQKYEVVAGTDPCSSDADCVKAECCHPTTCVAADKAPKCGDVACTLDCRVGTTDCYGGCLCQDGKCAARRWLGPSEG